jgi:hypothetical protein
MSRLNDSERNLLRRYAEREWIIRGNRTATHEHYYAGLHRRESGQCARLTGRCDGSWSERFEL